MHAMASTTPLWWAPWSRWWSTKKCILAALLGSLVAVVIVAGISISLAPAHLTFAVVWANISSSPSTQKNLATWYYNLTVNVSNRSWRTGASFVSISADIWRSETAWIPAEEASATELWLPPRGSARVNFSVEGGQYNEQQDNKAPPPPPPPVGAPPPPAAANTTNQTSIPSIYKVVVEAKVKFKSGGVSTLPYTVMASCANVNFGAGVNYTSRVNCTS